MKKILVIFLSVFIFSTSNAKDASEFFSNIIPGEGLTEASIQINENDNPDLEILALREIESTNNSNLFTQFSIHTQETNGHNRLIGNLGLGYRKLSEDKSSMMGINVFLDNDFNAGHQRGSVGFELKGANLDLTANSYHKITNMEVVEGTEEQVLSGHEINLSSQIPYMPWSKINWKSYSWDNEKASTDTEGDELSLEMALTPTIQFNVSGDFSDTSSVDDEYNYKLSFVYPPRDNQKTLKDGLIANTAFEKENVEKKLKEKVRRSNNLAVEIQGAVIITKK